MRPLIPTTLTLIEGPAMEPLDLDQTRKHLRFPTTSEDSLIDGWIAAARQYFEEQTGRQVMTATWELWLDAFPFSVIELPKPPLLTVESVVYVDGSGAETTMDPSTYSVFAPEGPQAPRGWVQRSFGSQWPTPQDDPGAVRVRFTAGYGQAPGDVPELVRTILQLLVGQFHKYRSETVETRYDSALSVLPLGTEVLVRSFAYSAKAQRPARSITEVA